MKATRSSFYVLQIAVISNFSLLLLSAHMIQNHYEQLSNILIVYCVATTWKQYRTEATTAVAAAATAAAAATTTAAAATTTTTTTAESKSGMAFDLREF